MSRAATWRWQGSMPRIDAKRDRTRGGPGTAQDAKKPTRTAKAGARQPTTTGWRSAIGPGSKARGGQKATAPDLEQEQELPNPGTIDEFHNAINGGLLRSGGVKQRTGADRRSGHVQDVALDGHGKNGRIQTAPWRQARCLVKLSWCTGARSGSVKCRSLKGRSLMGAEAALAQAATGARKPAIWR